MIRMSFNPILTLLILIMSASFFLPAFGQEDWYDRWVGTNTKNYDQKIFSGFKVEEFVTDLSFPTTMTFVDNELLILQKNNGHIIHVDNDGISTSQPILDLNVTNLYESGALGIISSNSDVYVYYTESNQDGGEPFGNNIYKYQWMENTLQNPRLVKSLPAFPNSLIHNGGPMVIDNENTLYAIIGDQHMANGGTILQNLFEPPNDTGVIVPLESNDGYFAIGIRNSFGLTIDPLTGNMWQTENGPGSYDEINLVYPKFNSGWSAHTGPISESRIDVLPLPDIFGIWKSHLQLFFSSILINFYLGESYEYDDPKFSWKTPVSPTALAFSDSSYGDFKNWLFVGDCNNGNIYKFKLNSDRTSIILQDETMKDLVQNESDNNEEIIFGQGFGCITDIKFKDGVMYVASLTDGIVYKITPTF